MCSSKYIAKEPEFSVRTVFVWKNCCYCSKMENYKARYFNETYTDNPLRLPWPDSIREINQSEHAILLTEWWPDHWASSAPAPPTLLMLIPVRFSTTCGIFSIRVSTSPDNLAAPTSPLPLDTIVIFLALHKGAEISAAICNQISHQ